MSRIINIAKYVIKKITKDKRNVAILVVPACLILTLFYFLFPEDSGIVNIAFDKDLPSMMKDAFDDKDFLIFDDVNQDNLKEAFDSEKIDIYLKYDKTNAKVTIMVSGANMPADANSIKTLQKAMGENQKKGMSKMKDAIVLLKEGVEKEKNVIAVMLDTLNDNPDIMVSLIEKNKNIVKELGRMKLFANKIQKQVNDEDIPKEIDDKDFRLPSVDIDELYPIDTMIEAIMPYLMVCFIFFFVYMIGGIYFLREKQSGTLERILFSPLSSSELVIGYVMGFGMLAIFQMLVIMGYVEYVLHISLNGKFWEMFVINTLIALVSIALSITATSLVSNEFQMIQTIPMLVIPQIFLSNLFPLDDIPTLDMISKILPLRIGCDVAVNLIIKGQSLVSQSLSMLYICGWIAFLIVFSVATLKKK